VKKTASPKTRKKAIKKGATINSVATKKEWNISVKPLTPFLIGFGSLFIAVFLYQMVLNIKLPIKDIYIDGPFTHVERSYFEQSLMPLVGEHILNVDIDNVKKILESHGLVRQVQVKRQWPDAIEVQYQEELPVAIWGQHYLNHEGHVLNVEQQIADLILPELNGPKGSAEQVMAQYHSLGRIIDAQGLNIKVVELTSRGTWSLGLDNGLQLQLGRDSLSEKLSRFDRVYSALTRYQNRIATVDLRYSNGVAVSWKKISES
jgi:cell division protein FtsQ